MLCCCWVTSGVSDSVRPQRWQPTRMPRPWDSPGKNTGVGCHFLLQCMKVKRESEVAQSCPTLSDPMDCSLPGSSIHGIFQARVLEWGVIAFSKDYAQPTLTQRSHQYCAKGASFPTLLNHLPTPGFCQQNQKRIKESKVPQRSWGDIVPSPSPCIQVWKISVSHLRSNLFYL